MTDEEIRKLSKKAQDILANFKEEVSGLRAGRATPALVENIEVECYGSKMRLREVATIAIQQPNVILVQPWDKGAIQAIEKAILQSDLGGSPAVDGNTVRVTLPLFTEERRKELVKLLGKKAEETRIAFRMARDESRKAIQQLVNKKKISEDEKFRADSLLQKETDSFNADMDALVEEREKEIMTV